MLGNSGEFGYPSLRSNVSISIFFFHFPSILSQVYTNMRLFPNSVFRMHVEDNRFVS